MKIISKFKDYYDHGCAWGVDETQLLKRTTKQNTYEVKEVLLEYDFFWDHTRFTLKYLWFCGELYPLVTLTSGVDENNFYTLESLEKALPQEYLKGAWLYKIKYKWFRSFDFTKEQVASFFAGEVEGYNEVLSLAEKLSKENKVPYILFEESIEEQGKLTVTEYPELYKLDFVKSFDPFTAFQEIQMYKFGVLGADANPTVEIEDKYKVKGKGFDDKYGFRTRPKGGE